MLDFDQLTETLFGLAGSEEAGAAGITELLGTAGIDAAMLEGLSVDQALGVLETAGIDVSALTDGQMQEIIDTINQLRSG